uniref:Fatty-acid amide hydrolase 1 n=1 Tax=Myripristis murdjan TaxID=586833 RepID=A0A667Y147_9TELE
MDQTRNRELLSLTAILTTAACGLGALVVLVKKFSLNQGENKIVRARQRRAVSLKAAEEAVLKYREAHPGTDAPAILSLSLSELTKCLRDGSLSPEDVFYSYMEKTLDVNKRLNCCTGILLESFDQLKTVGSSKEGLLYGVPISIKENIDYKGYDSTCGVVSRLEQPAPVDSVLVEVLKRQGAIPFVKTNIPQSMLNYDCGNPIYGQTLHPRNPQKTPGGSSGGEGALIATGGSLLGCGTDIGGSIRFPASFCGICGFKPTAGRLSSKGISSISRGQKSVLASVGPLARDVDSLALFMQAVLCDHLFSLDPTVPPIPFNLEIYQSSRPLRIGYFEDDSYQQPSPSMIRSLREVKALLERAGHTVVPFTLPRIRYALMELTLKGVLADGGVTMLNSLKGCPLDPCLSSQILPYYLPNPVKKLLSFLLKPLVSSPTLPVTQIQSVPGLWKQHASVEDYIHETIAEWRRCELDVLLCPMLGPAFKALYPGKLTCATSYTIIYNALNFPAGAVPVDTVTAEDEEELKHYEGKFKDFWDRLFKEAVSGAEGLPTAVQCVALPWQDELCLRFMREVEQLVKQNRK